MAQNWKGTESGLDHMDLLPDKSIGIAKEGTDLKIPMTFFNVLHWREKSTKLANDIICLLVHKKQLIAFLVHMDFLSAEKLIGNSKKEAYLKTTMAVANVLMLEGKINEIGQWQNRAGCPQEVIYRKLSTVEFCSRNYPL